MSVFIKSRMIPMQVDEDIFEVILESSKNLEERIANLKGLIVPLATSYNENNETWTPLQRANSNIAKLYLINSLFFMHMNLNNVDIEASGIKAELDRIKHCLKELRETEEKLGLIKKPSRPHVNTHAATKFINSALWQPNSSLEKDK